MNTAIILCAGFGTRLKPWTDSHPKALVRVGGIPMLERVIRKIQDSGFSRIIINVHHFGDQIIEFIERRVWESEILISDETKELLDTGGGVLKCVDKFDFEGEGVLVHNVDILSNIDLGGLRRTFENGKWGTVLSVSERESSRKLVFTEGMLLKGWENINTGETRPEDLRIAATDRMLGFNGIYFIGRESLEEMKGIFGIKKFPVMDYFLSNKRHETIYGIETKNLSFLDIGKPETLSRANLEYL